MISTLVILQSLSGHQITRRPYPTTATAKRALKEAAELGHAGYVMRGRKIVSVVPCKEANLKYL